LVSVFPGSPTAAELFILPETNQSVFRSHTEEQLDKVRATHTHIEIKCFAMISPNDMV